LNNGRIINNFVLNTSEIIQEAFVQDYNLLVLSKEEQALAIEGMCITKNVKRQLFVF
jgi:hypothetical protein